MFCVSNDDLRNSLQDSLWDLLEFSLRYSLRNSLGESLWGSLEFSLRYSLWDLLWESLRESLTDVYKGVEYVLCV